MPRGIEEAVATCAECGLTGKIVRKPPTGAMMVFAPFAEFEALCRKVVPNYVEACPYWVEAQHAAIPNLKPSAEPFA
ncbi:MAG TPA: hypothetical protein VHL98_13010 [Microvirga sp.]|jgi:hypothetical protein|nr:hypothetical protein [Microvirga sp.]